jgi:hypothetical protein
MHRYPLVITVPDPGLAWFELQREKMARFLTGMTRRG